MKNGKWRRFLIPVVLAILLQFLGEVSRMPVYRIYRISAVAFFAGETHVNVVGDRIFHGTVSESVKVGQLVPASKVRITD
jgi:hypothetical protein